METNDPALTKTPIGSHDALGEVIDKTSHHKHSSEHMSNTTPDEHLNNQNEESPHESISDAIVGKRVDHQEPLANNRAGGSAIVNDDATNRHRDTDHHNDLHNNIHSHEEVKEHTETEKGTETLDNEVIHSEHVNDGDNPARQPDRRDQQGSTAFDEGINEETVGSEAPKSEGLTEMNRYANVNNAQTRILNPDEKD